MALMNKVSSIFDIYLPSTEVFCKLFEDNKSCIAVSESKIFSPRTKHIAIKYNHFRIFVQKNIIRICYIDKREQTAEF